MDRRRVVVVTTFLIGSVMLGFTLNSPHGSGQFYWLSSLLAVLWIGGALSSGPITFSPPGRYLRGTIVGIVGGIALAAVFCIGALIAREIPFFDSRARDVLAFAVTGSPLGALSIALVNGIAEEMFFRGAVFAALTRHRVILSTTVYVIATAASGNPLLVIGALVLGWVSAIERYFSGGVLASILTHVTWSVAMFYLLPLIF